MVTARFTSARLKRRKVEFFLSDFLPRLKVCRQIKELASSAKTNSMLTDAAMAGPLTSSLRAQKLLSEVLF